MIFLGEERLWCLLWDGVTVVSDIPGRFSAAVSNCFCSLGSNVILSVYLSQNKHKAHASFNLV